MSDIFLEAALLPTGWAENVRVTVDGDGTIAAVEAGAGKDGAEAVAGIALPGMPNLHSHAFQRAAAGLTERRHSTAGDSFWTWREVVHDFVTKITPDDVEAIAAQLYVEMLKAGYTAVGEFHYVHHDQDGRPYGDPAEMSERVVVAAKRTGLGLSLLPVLYTVGGYGDVEPNAGQRRYMMTPDAFLDLVATLHARYSDDPQVRIGIAPHSIRQVPPDHLAACLDGFQGIDAGAPIHIHIAEQVRDVEASVQHVGAQPVEWLLANCAVDERWCLVHATHMTGTEMRGLAESGAVAGLCPTTEANLGDGIYPLADYLAAGGRLGIGSDSHISVSPVEELRWLEYVQRLTHLSRNVSADAAGGSTGARLYKTALAGGAQALGRPVGAIDAGHRADIVIVDGEHPQLIGRQGDVLLDSLIFAGNANPVRHVMVGGAWCVRGGHHADEDAIAQSYRKTVEGLLQ